MRVLRISHSAAVDEWRGRERALTDLGVDVHLLCAPTEDLGGSTAHLEPREGEQVRGVRRFGSHPALFVYDPRPLWRALGERWDVVDIHEEPFALATAEILLIRALRRNRAPFVLYTAQNLLKRYPAPFRWFERIALRRAAGISACSVDAARIAEAKGFPGSARVIPLGVDTAQFSAAPARGASIDTETVTAGYIGRLVPEKGVAVLLDAAADHPGIRLRIAGDGPGLAGLREHVDRAGIADRVEFVGALAPDAVPAFYRSLDVLAVPSLPTHRWTEQFGRVAVEAMACGVPVVSSDAGALPDVVGGAGLVVPQGDAGALAAAILEAAGPRAAELRASGFARAAQCTWESVGRDYLDLYRAVLRSGPASAVTTAASGLQHRALAIIVVAYGSPDLLRIALEPLTGMPVTVVDNSSLPEIAQLCEELGATYVDAGGNRGFAAGVNRGLAERPDHGADVLLINPDARVTPEQIGELLDALHADPALASVAPAQIDESGSRAQVSWLFPSPGKSWLEALGLSRLRRGDRFVIGSVLLLRAEAIAHVGGFDERYFLYAEETDWAFRAHLLGWRHAEVASVVAMHTGAGTSSDERRRQVHFHASQERYFRKHFGAIGWQMARGAIWVGSMARAIGLSGERGREARRRAALYRLGPIRVEERRAPREASA